jgi:hypothetical protein
MKKYLSILAISCAVGSALADTTFLNESFNGYSNGNLSGQGGWAATASAATPMQVSSGTVVLGTSGQDEYKALSSPISLSLYNTITTTATITITAAKANGDYFLHLSDPAGTASLFFARFYAKSSGAGFVFGITPTSGTAAAGNYGTTVLTLNQAYTVSFVWSHITGNDSFAINVNGSSYLSGITTPAFTTEPLFVAAVNLRQGNASNAPNVIIDNLVVTAVPEPHEYAIAMAGLLGAVILMRRRRMA